MSNRAHRRPSSRADDLSDICVFCEMLKAADHVLNVVVPTIADRSDRDYMKALAASVSRDAEAMSAISERAGHFHPPEGGR